MLKFRMEMQMPIRRPRYVAGMLLGLLLYLFFLPACRQKMGPQQVDAAFYYWQTDFKPGVEERAFLKNTDSKILYIKFLDIGLDPVSGAIAPYSHIKVSDSIDLTGLEIIPVVFITNEVFKKINADANARLAEKIVQAIADNAAQLPSLRAGRGAYREIQFDCDWTQSTRGAYFDFLKLVRQKIPPSVQLSATIRLHQYKFPEQTGVPPVARGMLMLYNTGDVESWETGNSIFDKNDALKYLQGLKQEYPLPLDLTLPVFSWTLVYREGSLYKIIPELQMAELQDTTRFAPVFGAPTAKDRRFQLIRASFVAGHYLRPGDYLRYECLSASELQEAASVFPATALADTARIAFFHLDDTALHRYPAQTLKTICDSFSQKSPK